MIWKMKIQVCSYCPAGMAAMQTILLYLFEREACSGGCCYSSCHPGVPLLWSLEFAGGAALCPAAQESWLWKHFLDFRTTLVRWGEPSSSDHCGPDHGSGWQEPTAIIKLCSDLCTTFLSLSAGFALCSDTGCCYSGWAYHKPEEGLCSEVLFSTVKQIAEGIRRLRRAQQALFSFSLHPLSRLHFLFSPFPPIKQKKGMKMVATPITERALSKHTTDGINSLAIKSN